MNTSHPNYIDESHSAPPSVIAARGRLMRNKSNEIFSFGGSHGFEHRKVEQTRVWKEGWMDAMRIDISNNCFKPHLHPFYCPLAIERYDNDVIAAEKLRRKHVSEQYKQRWEIQK